MALTRKMLKAMGIEEEKIDQIIEAHTETTEALKKERDDAKEQAAKNEQAAKDLEELKANPGDDYQGKYEAEHKAFEEYKEKVEKQAEIDAAKALFRAQLEEVGITGNRATQIIKATDIAAFKVKDGAFEDAEQVKKHINEEWSEFVPKTKTQGAKVQTPPGNNNEGSAPTSLADALRERMTK